MPFPFATDLDDALALARRNGQIVLLNFDGGPISQECMRMENETYSRADVRNYILKHFIAARVKRQGHSSAFERYTVQATPAHLLLDGDGREHYRLLGFHAAPEFLAQLELGRGHVAFAHEKWEDGERHFLCVYEQNRGGELSAEALYWSGVAHFRRTRDEQTLKGICGKLAAEFPGTIWARQANSLLNHRSTDR